MTKKENQDVLIDKNRPWKEKKKLSISVSSSFRRSGLSLSVESLGEKLEKKADRILNCGSWLEFAVVDGQKKLHRANFCKERMCPMCQWRRSLRVFADVSKVMNEFQNKNPDAKPVFLTLTLKSCKGDELKKTIDILLSGWYKLFRKPFFKRNFLGWFRALEVTYNDISDTYHPHIHAILFAKKTYFYKSNKDYMDLDKWIICWQNVLGVDYKPNIDIRAVKSKDKRAKNKENAIANAGAIAEVSKYTVKMDFVEKLDKLKKAKSGNLTFEQEVEFMHEQSKIDNALVVLSQALKGKRLYAFGDELKRIAERFNCEDVEKADLIHIDDEKLRDDVIECIEVYRWVVGWGNYYKTTKAELHAEDEQLAQEHKIKCKLVQDEIQAIKEIDESILNDKIKETEKWTEV